MGQLVALQTLKIMDINVRIKTLFKCLLVVYVLTLVALLNKINDEPRNLAVELGEPQLRNLSKFTRNKTKYVYINRTETKYVYLDRVVYKPNFDQYGPGENGRRVALDMKKLSKDALKEIRINKKRHGFNTFISDIVNLRRGFRDKRPKLCRDNIYPDSMPPASVVIIFRDEWHSILLRTVYSVFERSPEHLIKEIILVDDGSKNADLKAKVDVHVAAVDKLKLVRNAKPLGLMMARQKGIEATSADYFIVMDGHMEVNEGWLEPLIFRLLQKPNALLCSNVGVINPDTLDIFIDGQVLSHSPSSNIFPFFDHIGLDQMWASYSQEFRHARNGSLAPIEYATIQGMMTVMRKEFFLQLGGFDPGMRVWGSEQIELSVKVWLCGGQVEMVPCSKVAHMYRITPWGGFNASNDYHSINKHRMSEVWMGGYQLDLMRDFLKSKTFEPGNITDRLQIRERNHCKPYKYFLDKVRSFSNVYIPEHLTSRGPVLNKMMNRCLDCAKINGSFHLILYVCNSGANQYFIHTRHSQIRGIQGNLLNAFADNTTMRIDIKEVKDNWQADSAMFEYLADNTIRSPMLNRCLTAVSPEKVTFGLCKGTPEQQWTWLRLNDPAVNVADGR